jgi:ATP-dependent RNA helicase RhlB
LAEQVYENAIKFVGDSGLRAVAIYGGVSYDKQKEGLRNGVEFVIATPGRLIDLFKEHLVDLKQVRGVVFDEADRMFDMGFKDDMKFILQRIPKERQFMVFSATLNLDVLNTAYQFGANPVEVNVSRDQAKAENVEDKIFHVGQDEKGPHLLSLLRKHNPRQSIVFSNFKMNVPRITQFLNDNGMPAVGISSLLTQSQRNRVMEQFKGESDHNILVATDVAARGLDIKGVDMVVNFELPDDPENYVHRIGRTGRAGEKGIAFSLVSERDVDALARVEQYLKHKIDASFLEESELVKDFKAMPNDRGGSERRDFRSGGPSGGRDGRGGGSRGGPRPGGRDEGRGEPRRDGGRGDGGRRHEGRGPRRGDRDRGRDQAAGERQDRPQQSASGAPGGAPHRGGSHGGQGQQPGPHRSRRPENGRRHEGRGPQRHEGQGRGNGHGPHRQGEPRHGNRPQRGRGGQPFAKPNAKPSSAQSPSLGQKVSGFFKRLFGG